jgi:large subunit ribosomal protein L3
LKGHLSKSGVKSCSHIAEFRVSDECVGEIGAEILADHFIKGQKVDVVGTTIGKGFAGPMKRHNFGGMRASHGVSVSHRAHGSTGNCQDPGKVFKNKKMAGHMGNAACTVQNLTIVDIDTEDGILLIKGAVPGAKGSVVYIKDAVKVELPNDLPMPGSFEGGKDASSQQKANEAVDKSQAVEKEANKEKVKAEAEKQEADKKAEESQKTENKEEVKE